MPVCPHVQWLDLDGIAQEWSLLDPKRLGAVTNCLRDSAHQFPSLVFFIGKRTKSVALKGLYGQNNPSRRRPHEIGNLYIDSNTAESHYPILFADCTYRKGWPKLDISWNGCHDQTRHLIHRTDSQPSISMARMISYIHVNLLFPFIHVLCIFANDLGGNEACAHYIKDWFHLERKSAEASTRTRPTLVIVTDDPSSVDPLVQLECHSEFKLLFDSLSILSCEISKHPSDPAAQYLQARMKFTLDEIRRDRQEHNLLLSAHHITMAFSHAVHEFTRVPRKVVDIFLCSNGRGISSSKTTACLSEFVAAAEKMNAQPAAVYDFIASAFLAYSYPPQGHCRCKKHAMPFPNSSH